MSIVLTESNNMILIQVANASVISNIKGWLVRKRETLVKYIVLSA